jgi:pSer/pThr/pTyr-binding forkhead associated (FHA) protein
MPLRLVSLDGSADIGLDRVFVIVGRGRRCHVRLNAPQVSRRHCSLTRNGEGILVLDLGSTNGTWINGWRVTQGPLNLGDTLWVARYRYRLEGSSGT